MFAFVGTTPGNFNVIVENHDVHQAYKDLKDFILKELEHQKKEGVVVDLTRVNID